MSERKIINMFTTVGACYGATAVNISYIIVGVLERNTNIIITAISAVIIMGLLGYFLTKKYKKELLNKESII